MRIAVTGSIATDHLMVFPGRFADQLLPDQLDKVSLSFLVDTLDVRRGGVAANVSFGLGTLGLRPLLVGAVGRDFTEYREWLAGHGVDTTGVHVSRTRNTARFLCTTDSTQNQIASFYPGAMSEAKDIRLAPIADRVGGLDIVLIAPNDPAAMLRHTEECRTRGYRFAADPSQQLATLDTASVQSLVDGADLLFTNEYESSLLEQSTGWSHDQVLSKVGSWVTTLGARGVRVESAAEPAITVPAVPTSGVVDPTGAGDAFRAGFLAGLAWRLSTCRAAQLGCMLAVTALEALGPQDYVIDDGAMFLKRLDDAYGVDAYVEIAPRLAHLLDTGETNIELGRE
jgi:adenosine kinase